MKVYYYAHTGHRIGLDRFRRASAIIKALEQQGVEVTLLSSDYRIASVAKEYGIMRSVGVDVVRNIANIAYQGEKLIFDSDEANPIMLEDMRSYFSTFIHINDNPEYIQADGEFLLNPYLKQSETTCNELIVDAVYEKQQPKTIQKTFFFGDDDYEKDLLKEVDFLKTIDPYLQLGFYYFLDVETTLEKEFPNHFSFEQYQTMIQTTQTLITASPQAVLESLASGATPIYYQREDYPFYYQKLFEKLGIPIINNYNKNELLSALEQAESKKYTKIQTNSYKIAKKLKNWLFL